MTSVIPLGVAISAYSVGSVDTTSPIVRLATTFAEAYRGVHDATNPPLVEWTVRSIEEGSTKDGVVMAAERSPVAGPSGYGVVPAGVEWAWLAWEQFSKVVRPELAGGLVYIRASSPEERTSSLPRLCRQIAEIAATTDLAISYTDVPSFARKFALRVIEMANKIKKSHRPEVELIDDFYKDCTSRFPFFYNEETKRVENSSDPAVWEKIQQQKSQTFLAKWGDNI